MKEKGIEAPPKLSPEEKQKNQAKLAQIAKESEKKIEEMSNEELLNHNEDNMRIEK